MADFHSQLRHLLTQPVGQHFHLGTADVLGAVILRDQDFLLDAIAIYQAKTANDDAGQQRLIPFVDQHVLEVVPAEGRILVDWGLDY